MATKKDLEDQLAATREELDNMKTFDGEAES